MAARWPTPRISPLSPAPAPGCTVPSTAAALLLRVPEGCSAVPIPPAPWWAVGCGYGSPSGWIREGSAGAGDRRRW